MEREIYKGREHRLHAAKMSGKIVMMKVYEGIRAREVGFTLRNHMHSILTVLSKRCLEAARFNQNIMYAVSLHIQTCFRTDNLVTSHPNIAQMIGVSPLRCGLSYLVFDGGP